MRKYLLALTLLALAACQADPPTVPATVKAAEAKAKADSLRGVRFDSIARHQYRLGQIAADSANHYYRQSHALPASPTDSATLLRTITDYFTPAAR